MNTIKSAEKIMEKHLPFFTNLMAGEKKAIKILIEEVRKESNLGGISKPELIEFITALGENCGNEKKMEWYHGLISDMEIAWSNRVNDDSLTIEDYKEAIEDNKRLVRELDVLINGENAAKQASLCDIVSQLKTQQPTKSVEIKKWVEENMGFFIPKDWDSSYVTKVIEKYVGEAKQPINKVNDVSAGTILLAELLKRKDEVNEDGMPVVKIIDKPNGGAVSYLRHDAVVKYLNQQGKVNDVDEDELWEEVFRQIGHVAPYYYDLIKLKKQFSITRKQ